MSINIKNNYGPNIEVNEGGVVNLYQDKNGSRHHVHAEEAEIVESLENDNDEPQQENPISLKPQPTGDSFVERTKAIMRKAATMNGQTIESRAKGHKGSYTYNINSDAFCKAMDALLNDHSEKLSEFLGGDLYNTQVTKVCFFIGQVIRMNIINAPSLQIADMIFAFDDYYSNKSTVKSKLSDYNSTTQDQRLLMGIFQGLLKRYIA
jgi:hypothetical protein